MAAAMSKFMGSLTVADLTYSDLNTESATMLATIAKEKQISLCGIRPQDETAVFASYGDNRMTPADAILLTADLTVRKSLRKVYIPAIARSVLSECPCLCADLSFWPEIVWSLL